jgi:VanZ family protein
MKRKIIRYWLPLILYCGLILFQATLPIAIREIHYGDKLIHFVIYGILGILTYRAVRSLPGDIGLFYLIFLGVVISGIIGICDEVIKIFTPNRTLDVVDFFFDVSGSLTGISTYVFIRSRRGKNKENQS